MRDLNIYNIPLGEINLERIDINSRKHKKAISKLRDFEAKKMMFDVKQTVNLIKNNREVGNSYLIKKNKDYIGYIYISNVDNNESRVISMMIERSVRNKGYGKIVLNSISTYLFEKDLAKSIFVYIKDKNTKSKAMASSCGYSLIDKMDNNTGIYERKR